jgi:hypothetical protein
MCKVHNIRNTSLRAEETLALRIIAVDRVNIYVQRGEPPISNQYYDVSTCCF